MGHAGIQPPFSVTDKLLTRFWTKVRKMSGPDDCWLWIGGGRGQGYGTIKIERKVIDAHVASWRIHNGGIAVPVGKLVMHTCDVKLCIRPDHLVLGTTSENMKDASDKGLLECDFERIPDETKRRIRDDRKRGATYRELADHYHVAHTSVIRICKGR